MCAKFHENQRKTRTRRRSELNKLDNTQTSVTMYSISSAGWKQSSSGAKELWLQITCCCSAGWKQQQSQGIVTADYLLLLRWLEAKQQQSQGIVTADYLLLHNDYQYNARCVSRLLLTIKLIDSHCVVAFARTWLMLFIIVFEFTGAEPDTQYTVLDLITLPRTRLQHIITIMPAVLGTHLCHHEKGHGKWRPYISSKYLWAYRCYLIVNVNFGINTLQQLNILLCKRMTWYQNLTHLNNITHASSNLFT